MKKTIALAILATSATSAQAGFFDSFFGKKETPVVQEAPADVTTAAQATEAVKAESTGLASMAGMATGLIPTLTQGLGISNDQAEGGMGALLQVAQSNLSGDEFGSLSQGIPGIEGLLSAAPSLLKSAGGASTAGGLSSVLSSVSASGALGDLGKLTQQFEALGLSPDMIIQLAKMAIEYFSGDSGADASAAGSADIGGLLQKGLGAILG
jgi:Protein of unknown function VcgC/VcgE (DUF2780)